MPRVRFLLALVLCAVFAGVAGVPAAAASGRAATGVVGLPEIVQLGKEKARHDYPGAVFYGAEGYLQERTTNPDDVSQWQLNFADREGDQEFDFQYIYSPDGQYLATGHWDRPLGIEPVRGFSLTQEHAVRLLRSAGHTGKFDQLYLAQPVVPNSEPIYYFCLVDEGQTVGVGTHTHKVYNNLFPCS
jgi:hypothetical protein